MKARVNLLNSQMLPIVGIIRRALFLKCSSVRGVIKKTLFFRLKIKPRFPDSSLLLSKINPSVWRQIRVRTDVNDWCEHVTFCLILSLSMVENCIKSKTLINLKFALASFTCNRSFSPWTRDILAMTSAKQTEFSVALVEAKVNFLCLLRVLILFIVYIEFTLCKRRLVDSYGSS